MLFTALHGLFDVAFVVFGILRSLAVTIADKGAFFYVFGGMTWLESLLAGFQSII